MIEFNDCPSVNERDVCAQIKNDVGCPEYLYCKSSFTEVQVFWEEPEKIWEGYCTYCGEYHYYPKKEFPKLKDIKFCECCGMPVDAKRESTVRRALTLQRFSYHYFLRGKGSSIWIISYDVRRDYDGDFHIVEYARCAFDYGESHRWRISWDCVKKLKTVQMTRMQRGVFGNFNDDFIGKISMDTIIGSCIQYSQLDNAVEYLQDPISYLYLYIKQPLVEMLWKFGLGEFFRDREHTSGFNKVVNLRAKSMKNLLFGLGKRDAEIIEHYSFSRIVIYRNLRNKGLPAETELIEYASGIYSLYEEERQKFIKNAEKIYKYIKKQARKSGRSICNTVIDYGDYLKQLEELEIQNPELYPDNLQAAHKRLSERILKNKSDADISDYRIRRKILRKYIFSWHGMKIRPIDSYMELVKEGEMQRHCVAGYANRHKEGRTAIFVLRKKADSRQAFCTVELNPATKEIRQCRTYKNADAPPEAKEFMEKWTEFLRCK